MGCGTGNIDVSAVLQQVVKFPAYLPEAPCYLTLSWSRMTAKYASDKNCYV